MTTLSAAAPYRVNQVDRAGNDFVIFRASSTQTTLMLTSMA
jgi:hypothetical protein